MSKNTRGSLILLLTAMIWGTCFVAQSSAMDAIGPLQFVVTRFIIGGTVLLPVISAFNKAKRNSGKITKEELKENTKYTVRCGLLSGTALCAGSILQQLGLMTTTAGKSGFITALYIILVPLAGILIGKKPPVTIWISVVVAITGFYLLCIKEGFRIAIGDFYTLLCAVGFTVMIMLLDHFTKKGADPLTLSCTQFYVTAAILFVPMLIFEGYHMQLIMDAKIPLLYAGIMSSGVAYTLQIFGQRDTNPTLATLIMSLESVFAALSGWLILHESLTTRELIGCILVFAAVLFAQFIPQEA